MHGNKVMMLFIPTENIHFFDSYSFLHMPLSVIPKGDLNYEGEIVERKYFDVENMSRENQVDFEKWYLFIKIKYMCLKRRCIIIVVQMSIF